MDINVQQKESHNKINKWFLWHLGHLSKKEIFYSVH